MQHSHWYNNQVSRPALAFFIPLFYNCSKVVFCRKEDPILSRRYRPLFSIMARNRAILAALTFLLFCMARPAGAAGGPFNEGSMRISLQVGNGYAFNQSYLVVGAGFGYFVAQNLELGLEADSWSGASPHITTISPEVRYVVPTGGSIRPYVGAFYRRTIIDGYDDLNSVGGRAGIYYVTSLGNYFGVGVAYEQYLSCNEAVYGSCNDTYPEILFAIAF